MRTLVAPVAVFILALAASAPAPDPDPNTVRYDQSQSGQYNIQLDFKNIEIFAILDELGLGSIQNDDYDYGELTLKPPAGWNTSTSSTVDEPTSKEPTNAETTTGAAVDHSQAPAPSPGTGSGTPASNQGASSNPPAAAAAGAAANPLLVVGHEEGHETAAQRPVRRCGAGFYRDAMGRCRRLRRPHNTALTEFFRKVQEKYKPSIE